MVPLNPNTPSMTAIAQTPTVQIDQALTTMLGLIRTRINEIHAIPSQEAIQLVHGYHSRTWQNSDLNRSLTSDIFDFQDLHRLAKEHLSPTSLLHWEDERTKKFGHYIMNRLYQCFNENADLNQYFIDNLIERSIGVTVPNDYLWKSTEQRNGWITVHLHVVNAANQYFIETIVEDQFRRLVQSLDQTDPDFIDRITEGFQRGNYW